MEHHLFKKTNTHIAKCCGAAQYTAVLDQWHTMNLLGVHSSPSCKTQPQVDSRQNGPRPNAHWGAIGLLLWDKTFLNCSAVWAYVNHCFTVWCHGEMQKKKKKMKSLCAVTEIVTACPLRESPLRFCLQHIWGNGQKNTTKLPAIWCNSIQQHCNATARQTEPLWQWKL